MLPGTTDAQCTQQVDRALTATPSSWPFTLLPNTRLQQGRGTTMRGDLPWKHPTQHSRRFPDVPHKAGLEMSSDVPPTGPQAVGSWGRASASCLHVWHGRAGPSQSRVPQAHAGSWRGSHLGTWVMKQRPHPESPGHPQSSVASSTLRLREALN